MHTYTHSECCAHTHAHRVRVFAYESVERFGVSVAVCVDRICTGQHALIRQTCRLNMQRRRTGIAGRLNWHKTHTHTNTCARALVQRCRHEANAHNMFTLELSASLLFNYFNDTMGSRMRKAAPRMSLIRAVWKVELNACACSCSGRARIPRIARTHWIMRGVPLRGAADTHVSDQKGNSSRARGANKNITHWFIPIQKLLRAPLRPWTDDYFRCGCLCSLSLSRISGACHGQLKVLIF